LFLTSAIVLYTELLLIRWIPAYVTYVIFFSNLVVMASFLGIGVGILVGRRTQAARFAPYGPALVLIALLVLIARIDVRPGTEDFLAALVASHAADPNLLVLPVLFVAVAAVLATLSLPLGPLLRAFPPLQAYAIDIGGAITGIVAFTIVSALGTPPAVWFALLGVALAARGAGRLGPPAVIGAASFAAVLTLTVLAETVSDDIWSPYYRISLFTPPGAFTVLAVNGIPHQNFYPLTSPRREPFYDQVYRWFPDHRFARVLIIGAGNGTDVAGALAHGATSVDAVEIDPRILDLGRLLHPDRPYADPRVRAIVDDGRAELQRGGRTYDLIVFALTDSLTLASGSANLRLESFLYTEEALARARDRLAPDGVLTIYNYYDRPFLVAKLSTMLADVFGAPPVVRTYGGPVSPGAAFAAGPGAKAPVGEADAVALGGDVRPATDDWPFLYLEAPGIAGYYLVILGAFLIASLGAVLIAARAARAPLGRASPHFFMLGAAFLLLETKNLATFSLLFGSTWLVSALVFAGILLSVLAAIAVTARTRPSGPLPYVLLGASLLANIAVPPPSLLLDPPILRYAVATVLAFLPVFFANLVFTMSFRDTRSADIAFASNVLGAVVGGCLEYLALITGYRALLVVVAVLYALAFLLARRRFGGDRDLSAVAGAPAG
jgi:hypothetical protein